MMMVVLEGSAYSTKALEKQEQTKHKSSNGNK